MLVGGSKAHAIILLSCIGLFLHTKVSEKLKFFLIIYLLTYLGDVHGLSMDQLSPRHQKNHFREATTYFDAWRLLDTKMETSVAK